VERKKPLMVLRESLGKEIYVVIRGGREYRGILEGYDQHMNFVLRKVQESKDGEVIQDFPLVILRGDNVIYVSPP